MAFTLLCYSLEDGFYIQRIVDQSSTISGDTVETVIKSKFEVIDPDKVESAKAVTKDGRPCLNLTIDESTAPAEPPQDPDRKLFGKQRATILIIENERYMLEYNGFRRVLDGKIENSANYIVYVDSEKEAKTLLEKVEKVFELEKASVNQSAHTTPASAPR